MNPVIFKKRALFCLFFLFTLSSLLAQKGEIQRAIKNGLKAGRSKGQHYSADLGTGIPVSSEAFQQWKEKNPQYLIVEIKTGERTFATDIYPTAVLSFRFIPPEERTAFAQELVDRDGQQCFLYHLTYKKFITVYWKGGTVNNGYAEGEGTAFLLTAKTLLGQKFSEKTQYRQILYQGRAVGGKPDGYGTLYGEVVFYDFAYSSTSCRCKQFVPIVYQGFWSEGKKHGKGIFFPNDKMTELWEGNFENDVMEGQGVVRYPKRHNEFLVGTVSKSFADVSKLGCTCTNFEEGAGINRNISGLVYNGQFKNGLLNGQGGFVLENGERFNGTYVNGKRVGYGEWFWKDEGLDCYYKGDFQDDKRHGKGESRFILRDTKICRPQQKGAFGFTVQSEISSTTVYKVEAKASWENDQCKAAGAEKYDRQIIKSDYDCESKMADQANADKRYEESREKDEAKKRLQKSQCFEEQPKAIGKQWDGSQKALFSICSANRVYQSYEVKCANGKTRTFY